MSHCRRMSLPGSSSRAPGPGEGLPRNLAILHSPPLKAVAVQYWARTMRSPAGGAVLCRHARHAQAEMQILGDQVAARLADSPAASHLRQLVPPSPA